MRIAYVHTGTFPSDSPSMTFSTMTCLHLGRISGIRIDYFIKGGSLDSPEKILRDVFDEGKPENLNIHCLPKSLLRSNYFYYRKVCRRLCKIGNLDAIITRNVTFLPWLVDLRKKLNVKVYYETHDFWADLNIRDDIDSRKKRRYSILENRFIPYLDGVICLQGTQKKLYEKIFQSQRFHLIRTGLKIYNPPNEPHGKYISYIGSFDIHKGIETLIEAAAVSQSKPPILLIGGKSDEERKRILQWSAGKGYQEKTTVTGWVNKKKLHEYLNQTAVGVVSLTDTFFNRYLTSPLKIFDYYSHGIPVIASDFPALRELVDEGKTGYLFPADDITGLAGKIDLFFGNNNIHESMRETIHHKARELTWEKRAEKIIEMIEQ